VLVLQKQGLGPWPAWHYAVVNGYDAARGRVLLRSGTTRRLELPTSMFETSWLRADAWAIVVLDPGQMPARPDFERYMQAAAALEAVGQAHAASLAYTAAVRQWPAEPLPHLGLANLDAAAGRWRDAERAYADALRLDPHSAAALNNRAEALGRLGCPNAARTTLARGMAGVAPDDPLRPALERTQRDLDARAGVAAAADPDGCPPAAPP
jgi:tetratricopeptide (TPR) repeat protein